jgi:transposase
MKTLSLDLRERIVAAYDIGEGTREEIGRRFRVSLGMVKKLLAQRRRLGEIGPLRYRCGRKPKILQEHRERLRQMLKEKPGMTLEQMRRALSIECTLAAIHHALGAMGLGYKKKRFELLSRTGPTSPGPVADGSERRSGSIPRGWSSSMSRRQRPT